MTKVRNLRNGDIIDLVGLPYEVDLEEHPMIEFELAVVQDVEVETSDCYVVHTDQHGSWRVDPDHEFNVQGRVRR